MTQEQPSALTFNLEESVWLDQGERIQTIIGLELEPELTIQEDEHGVMIKGGLHLLGQYAPYEREESFEDYEGGGIPQRADSVRTTESGEREIKHFFPIEVSIPLNRIQSVEELYVQVESFDYDLPEPSCIQLAADVTISGMKEKADADVGQVEKTVASPPAPFPTFTHEVKIPEEVDVQRGFEEQSQPEDEFEENDGEIVQAEREYEDEEAIEYEDSSSMESVEERLSYEETIAEEASNDEERFPHYNMHRRHEPLSKADQVVEENGYEEPEQAFIEEEAAPKEKKRENALYLTEMLDKGDRESFTKMKMCIIQENESLDTIAERYGFSVQQLLRWNNMDMNHVEAGEIIYIPVHVQNE